MNMIVKKKSHLFTFGLAIRLLLIVYGVWQDEHFAVKYTDVDYKVFTDAAREMLKGGSPYDRLTYRYTPLLAFILMPNIILHEAFGKLVFTLCDILVAVVIYWSLDKQAISRPASFYCAFWLLNPLSINISTRGNADSVVCLLLHLTIYELLSKNLTRAALYYGIAVHYRIFPIFLGPTILLFLNDEFTGMKSKRLLVFQNLYGKIQFALISLLTFLFIGVICYQFYGFEFVYETYLYHLIRKDNRHNFSVHFYDIYLSYQDSKHDVGGKKGWQFLPLIVCQMFLAFSFYADIPYAFFLQTFAFVAFNKVCTAQYFLWYTCLLPLVLPRCSIQWREGLGLTLLWLLTQLLWLFYAYELEFLGQSTFFYIWIASLGFFLSNMLIIIQFTRRYCRHAYIEKAHMEAICPVYDSEF